MVNDRFILREWQYGWLRWDRVHRVQAGRVTTLEIAESAVEALTAASDE
jgi:hypothetical protein